MLFIIKGMRWDIFCRVIDNFGDIGVCWRLAAELAARGEAVRLWADDPGPLAWMVAGGREGVARLGVDLRPWDPASTAPDAPGEVVVEAFGCDPHPGFLRGLAEAARARGRAPAWFNLEYLSAESYVARCHGLDSPVMAGPAAGLRKRFFYPGFTAATGGLIREQGLEERQARFDRDAWLASLGLPPAAPGEGLVSLFCYEPAALPALLRQLAGEPVRLLVTPGRAEAALRTALQAAGETPPPPLAPAGVHAEATPRAVRAFAASAQAPAGALLPALPQTEFDHLLWACDLNFVRGEDSLARALWAGRPFIWQLYSQDDGAHHGKLEAFLDWWQAPPPVRAAHRAWNAGAAGPGGTAAPTVPTWPALGELAGDEAARAARQARDRLLAGPELVTGLLAAARTWNETG